jgi:hypothetical protein
MFTKGRRQSLERIADLTRSLKPVPVSLLFVGSSLVYFAEKVRCGA